MRKNLYIHYDSVTNHVMTRGMDLKLTDFDPSFIPKAMILSDATLDFGRFDVQTNFKILRTRGEVINYFRAVEDYKTRLCAWIDFESVEAMHQLTPNEISEMLYLFHANRPLKSAFFYKLQNNYVFLTLPNGLIKVYYRHVAHFLPRFQRMICQQTQLLVEESNRFSLFRKKEVAKMPLEIAEQMAPLFVDGLKINFSQAVPIGESWRIPINIIEDELTLLTQHQLPKEHVGFITYDDATKTWLFELNEEQLSTDTEDLSR